MVSSRRIAAGAACLLILSGAATLVAQWWFATAHPPAADWRAGAAFVKKHHKPGDVIRVHPAWTETPLPYLQSLGTSISTQNFPVREDFAGAERVWIVTDRDLSAEAVERLPFELSGDAAPETRMTDGGVAVLSATLPGDALPTDSLLERLPEANVRIEGPKGETHRCEDFDQQSWRWRCHGPGSRSYVGRDLRFFADDAHECIRAYPPRGDRRLVIEFPNLPTGEMLRLRGGLTMLAALAKNGSDVRMTASSDELPQLDVTLHKDRASWHAYDIAMPDGKTISLEIAVEAANTHKRFFCFNGWTYFPAVAEVTSEWRTRRHR